MRVDFNAKNIVSFVKENVPKFITEQQKKIILIVSVVLGLCCIAYWMRSRSLKERVIKLDGGRNSDINSGRATPENMSTSGKVQHLGDGVWGDKQLKREGSSSQGESPVTTELGNDMTGLTADLNKFPSQEGEGGAAIHPENNSNSSQFNDEALYRLQELFCEEGISLPEVLEKESSEIEQIEDEIYSDAHSCLDYTVEEFSVKNNDPYYPSNGKKIRAFIHELDTFDGEGSYRIAGFQTEKPKEGEVLLYFTGSSVTSVKIIEDRENNFSTLSFKTSWIEGEALPQTVLHARELKSNFDSKNSCYGEVRDVVKKRKEKIAELARLRKNAIEKFLSLKFSSSDAV